MGGDGLIAPTLLQLFSYRWIANERYLFENSKYAIKY